MKASELRIGNIIDFKGHNLLVKEIDENKQLVCAEYHTGNQIVMHIDNYSPIQLTPERLEKAGFRLKVYENSESAGYYKLPENLCQNEWIDKFIYYLPYFYLNTVCGGIIVKHLHELQNLIHSLTGQELTINL